MRFADFAALSSDEFFLDFFFDFLRRRRAELDGELFVLVDVLVKSTSGLVTPFNRSTSVRGKSTDELAEGFSGLIREGTSAKFAICLALACSDNSMIELSGMVFDIALKGLLSCMWILFPKMRESLAVVSVEVEPRSSSSIREIVFLNP